MLKNIFRSQLIFKVIILFAVSLTFPDLSLAAEGEEKWSYPAGGVIYSSPAIAGNGTIYVGSYDGNLHAIHSNGSPYWSYPTGLVSSSPAIAADGTIYVGSIDNNLYAINPDGTIKWSKNTGGDVNSSPAIAGDGTIYVGSIDGYLYAINPENGSENWTYPTGSVESSPAVGSDGTIYVGSYNNELYAIHPDGSLDWNYPTSASIRYSSAAIGSDGTVYICSSDLNLHAIASDGTFKWKFPTGDSGNSSPAIGKDGTIYVGSEDHNLYAINPDGSLKWRYETGNRIHSSPSIGSDGTIYVGSGDNHLYAINTDGSLRWSCTTGAIDISSPAIGNDGTVYIGSLDNNLYAIEGSGTLADSPWPMFHHNLMNTGRSSGEPNNPPDKPTLSSPEINATNVSLTPTLITGNFSDIDPGDTHLHTRWQVSTVSGFETTVLHLTSNTLLTSLTIPKLTLSEGKKYYWRVKFYDDHSTVSQWSDTFSFTTLTTNTDLNGNGIPDSQENETVDLNKDYVPDFNQPEIIKSLNTVVGEGQMGVSREIDPDTVTAIEPIESVNPETISVNAIPLMPLGLFGFRITLATPGDLAEVTVHFSEPAGSGLTWYMYNSVNEWVDYSNHAEFSTDRESVVLKLKDGGFGDADGIANGFIVDPGGFGIASWIEGYVRESGTDKSVNTATVIIEDIELNTALDGHYISMIHPGTYDVTVSAGGYKTITDNIVIEEGVILTKNFEIELIDTVPVIEVSQSVLKAAQDTQTVKVTNNSSPINGAAVEIPPGALHSDCTITIGIVNSPPAFPDNISLIGKVIEFGPEGITFAEPVLIKIPFLQGDLDQAGVSDPSELEVFTYNTQTSSWDPVVIDSIDEANNIIICKVDHFSLYAIGWLGDGRCFINTAMGGTLK